MAFFNPIYTPARQPTRTKATAEKKPDVAPRIGRIKPIIRRGPLALVWVNPNPIRVPPGSTAGGD